MRLCCLRSETSSVRFAATFPKGEGIYALQGAMDHLNGRKKMNLTSEMVPGICLLLAGAAMTVFTEQLCHKKKNVQPMKLLGLFLAFAGAVMVFLP